MASFNKVILIGNLTRDPELRYTPKGMAVAKVGLAINRNWTTESGEKKEDVTFVDIDCFGRLAENLAQYMRKGLPIMAEGRLKLDQWDDKQTGQKRSKLGVIAENIVFLGSPKGEREEPDGVDHNAGRAQSSAPRNPQEAREKARQESQPDFPPPDDDVPF